MSHFHQHEPIIIAVLVGMAVYLALVALMPKRLRSESTKYTRNVLQQLALEKPQDSDFDDENISLLANQKNSGDFMTRLFFKLPGTSNIYPKFLKAGMTTRIGGFFIRCILV